MALTSARMLPSERLEGDVAGEPVGDDDVDLVGHHVAALDVADEPGAGGGEGALAGQERVGLLDQRVALRLLLADGEEADPGLGDAVALAGEHRAHLGELHQPGRLALGVGAGVEQDRGRRARDRDRRGDGRAGHALDAAHAQQGRGHRRPGVAGRDHGRGLVVAHGLGRADERRVLLGADARARVVAHADDLGRGDHVELTAERLQDLGPPDEDDGDTQFGGGALRSLDDGVGSVVAAHGVDGDGQHHREVSRPRRPGGPCTSRSCRTRRAAA